MSRRHCMRGLRLIRLTLAAAVIGAALTVVPAVAASAAVQLCDRTLQYGDSGDCVAKLQRRLNELGLDCGNQLTADGAFGPLTRARVFAFQGRNGIPVGGIVS